jgi:hypothetical protein
MSELPDRGGAPKMSELPEATPTLLQLFPPYGTVGRKQSFDC